MEPNGSGPLSQLTPEDQCSALSSTGESCVMSLPSPSTVSLPVLMCGSLSPGFAYPDGPVARVGTGAVSTNVPEHSSQSRTSTMYATLVRISLTALTPVRHEAGVSVRS